LYENESIYRPKLALKSEMKIEKSNIKPSNFQDILKKQQEYSD